MADQTTLTDLLGDEPPPVAAEETNDEATDDEQPPTRSTLIEPADNIALDTWVAERTAADEPYGYCHLYLISHSDLHGVEHELRFEANIDLGAAGGTGTVTTSTESWGSVSVDAVHDWVIDWLLSELATPYHEDLRPIPVDNFRVFVTDNAHDHLADHDIDSNSLCEQLHGLPEHQPSTDYLTKYRTLTALNEWLNGDDGLSAYERRIEATIRARFGFTKRHGHQIPNPDPAYQDCSLDELHACLITVRKQISHTKQHRDELSSALDALETQWRERIQAIYFE
jgi:hypothetical protein